MATTTAPAPTAHTSYSCPAMLAAHALQVHLDMIARQYELAALRPRRREDHLANAEARKAYTWQHQEALAAAACSCP